MVEDIADRLVEALYAGNPALLGCRVNHARGILVEGVFHPTRDASLLCRASSFDGSKRSVVARFSSSTGDPDIPEDAPNADPRGLAIMIGDDLALVGHSIEAFPAKTPEEFLAFLEALNANGKNPERLDRHILDHPAAGRFLADRLPTSDSFTTLRYHMLHTYRLTKPDGSSTVGKLSVVGLPTEVDQTASIGADHVTGDLRRRLSVTAVELVLEFTAAGESGDLGDITTPLLDPGATIALGRIIIDRIAADQDVQRSLIFDPARLPDGLDFAGDPMVEARLRAYQLAGRRRTNAEDAPHAPASADASPTRPHRNRPATP